MTLDYGNYGISLIMGNAGFISSTEVQKLSNLQQSPDRQEYNTQTGIFHGFAAGKTESNSGPPKP